MPNAGDAILAEDFPTTVSDSQNTTGTTTSTTFTATLTGGTACAVSFVAPTSGRVKITITARVDNSTTELSHVSFRVGTGSTAGAGTQVLASSELRALSQRGTDEIAGSMSWFLSGLTAGSTYNVQQQFAVTGVSTGTFSRKQLIVEPCT